MDRNTFFIIGFLSGKRILPVFFSHAFFYLFLVLFAVVLTKTDFTPLVFAVPFLKFAFFFGFPPAAFENGFYFGNLRICRKCPDYHKKLR